ncbi:hypothetical protein L0Y69_03340 [bacterium]|nr:hypothetical protein [bacterium]
MKKTIIIILVAILVIGGAWMLSGVFMGSDEPAAVTGGEGAVSPLGLSSEGATGESLTGVTAEEGKAILALLNDLRSLQLDETFFSDPIFVSLEDWSVVLTPEPIGRPNPFAPIGEDTRTPPAPPNKKTP